MNIMRHCITACAFLMLLAACGGGPGTRTGRGSADGSTTQKGLAKGSLANETLATIMKRKSVRTYAKQEISQEQLDVLLKAGMAAPSSRDRRPWHFIVMKDKARMQQLGGQIKTASMLQHADKAIVVCADTTLSPNCWFLDCSAVAQNILLAAESLGLGSVWATVYPYPDRAATVEAFFHLPAHVKALAIIPLGYPAGQEQPKDKFDSGRVHVEGW